MVPNSFYELNAEERFAMMLVVDRNSTPEQRKRALQTIKAMPYEEFLQTTYWRTISDCLLQRHPTCCSCLKAASTQVHHFTYAHHGEEHLYLMDLLPVCRLCHEIKHELADVNRPDVAINDWTRDAIMKAAGLKGFR